MTFGRAGRVLLGTVVATGLAVWPAPAQAHVRAVASWPASGEVLTALPERVTVLYTAGLLSEPEVSVVDPTGDAVVDGEPVIVGQALTQAIEPSDAPGVYGATFLVISDDGHPVEGYFEFTVDPTATPTGNPAGPPPVLDLEDPPNDDEVVVSDTAEGNEVSPLLLTGLAGAAVLVVLIRLVGRRRRS